MSLFWEGGFASLPLCQQASLTYGDLCCFNVPKHPRQESLRVPASLPINHTSSYRVHRSHKIGWNNVISSWHFLLTILLFITQVWGLEMELTCFFTVWCSVSLQLLYSFLRVTHIWYTQSFTHISMLWGVVWVFWPSLIPILSLASMDIRSQEMAHYVSQCC